MINLTSGYTNYQRPTLRQARKMITLTFNRKRSLEFDETYINWHVTLNHKTLAGGRELSENNGKIETSKIAQTPTF